MKALPESGQLIIKPYIQKNAFFAHPEFILITMLCDEDPQIRKEVVSKIFAIRKNQTQPLKNNLRLFVIPEINFHAHSYTDMFFWNDISITKPPLIKNVSK